MSVAYRVNGSNAKYVKGGLGGDHLSKSHREHRRGLLDAEEGKPKPIKPSAAYNQGYEAYHTQRLKFEQAKQLNQVRKDLGLTWFEFNLMRDVQ